MSNYFAHPMGDYAQIYIDGTASSTQKPHTYASHGFSKIDWGVGGGQPVYSMTNGIVVNKGWLGRDGVSKYGVVIKTSDCGYSRMQAKLKGGTAADYPIFFTYIEMSELTLSQEVGDSITKGTQLGLTNSEYAGSNWHFDIQPWDRYGGDSGTTAEHWYGNITMTGKDAYGDKGANFQLKDHLDSHFSLDSNGNLKDHTGKYIGVNVDGIYYPPSSGGGVITNNTGMNEGGVDTDLRIGRWYSYAFMMQTPVYSSGSSGSGTGSGSSSSLAIQCSDEWIQIMVGVVVAECGWHSLAVSQAVLLVARNWAYSFSNSTLQSDNGKAEKKILTWGHGKSKSQLISFYEQYKDKTVEGENVVEFTKKILTTGQHYTYAEKDPDIEYYNGYGPADIEDITGFPGSNSSYSNLWVCHIYFGNRFTDWNFCSGDGKTKPSVLLGLNSA